MMLPKNLKVFLFAALSLAGCATVETREEWDRVKAVATAQGGLEARWEQSDADKRDTEARIAALLVEGLTEREALTIALMNNRRLQAAFEEIGIAKSDLVQAGLFTNPSLSAVFKFPFGGGHGKTDLEGLMSIAELWQVPLRKKVAEANLAIALLKVQGEVLGTIAETKQAYHDCAILMKIVEEGRRLTEDLAAMKEHFQYREGFGFTTKLDLYAARAAVLEQELEAARLTRDLNAARQRLNSAMGLRPEQSAYVLGGEIDAHAGEVPPVEELVARALAGRPDLQMARVHLNEAQRRLALEEARALPAVEAGVAYAHEDSTDYLGPALSLTIPLFDQNQAGVARARYRIRQAEKELEAKEYLVRQEVSAATERLALARQEVTLIRDGLLPLRAQALKYAETHRDTMEISMLPYLDARQRMSETLRRYLEALREYRSRLIDLERYLGAPLP